MFCEKCGSQLLEGAKFCGVCGAKTEPAPQPAYAAAAGPAPVRPVPPPPVYAPPPQSAYAAPQPPANYAQPGREPLGVGQYIGMFLLMCVPLLNVILLFMWSFGGSVNLNKKNFARASLLLGVIAIVLSIVFSVFLTSMLGELFSNMSYY